MSASVQDAVKEAAREVSGAILREVAASVVTGKTRSLLTSVQLWSWGLTFAGALAAKIGVLPPDQAALAASFVAIVGIVDRFKKGDLTLLPPKAA